jgi:hypothetical protein
VFILSFQNQSSVVTNADLQAFITDFQSQISHEFAQAWGVEAVVNSGGGGWQITIKDYPGSNDPQGALGYHFIDQNFNPYGIVFAQLAQDNSVNWTSVASHEGLEILADPLIDSTCFIDTSTGNDGTTGWLVAQEVCDAPERLTYPGAVNGTELSDFVFPGWFIPGYTGQVDQLAQVPGPLQLLSGGYVSVDQVQQASGWQQTLGDKEVQAMAEQMAKQMEKRQPEVRHVQFLPKSRVLNQRQLYRTRAAIR